MSALTLYRTLPAFGVHNPSPFCLKVQAAIALLPEGDVRVREVAATPAQGPRQKLPYADLPDGTRLSDSRNLLAWLRTHAGLDLPHDPVDTGLVRMVEESLYFATLRMRWQHHPAAVREAFFAGLPRPARDLVFWGVRRSVRAACHAQGVGRRPEAEVLQMVREELGALQARLGQRRWFGTCDRPHDLSELDVVVYAATTQLLGELQDPMTACMADVPALVAHQARVQEAIFGANRGTVVPLKEAV